MTLCQARTLRGTFARVIAALAAALPALALAATFEHRGIGYFVSDKRIELGAGISDPRGVKLARVYFKTGAQADYLFAPMQLSGNRYVATLPAPSASTPSIEYLFLALNNDGQVSRTDAYKVNARMTVEIPAWQSARNRGEVKIFTELPITPKTVAGFSDSVVVDVAESGARFGTTAGLYGAPGGAASGTTASAGTTTSTTAATTTASTATTTAATAAAATTAATVAATTVAVGGLSTAAIVGGVALAGAAVAAAASSGGGGGGGGSSPSLAGAWSGTFTATEGITCNTPVGNCNYSAPWSGTIDAQGVFTGNVNTASYNCTGGINPSSGSVPAFPLSFTVSSTGAATVPRSNLTGLNTINGGAVTCSPLAVQFSASPRRVTGSNNCSGTGTDPGPPPLTCTQTIQNTFSGS